MYLFVNISFPFNRHNDLPYQYRKIVRNQVEKLNIAANYPDIHTDIPRLRQGHVGGQVYVLLIS